jgi:hypothetical protein
MSFKIPNSIRDPKDLINLLRDEETTLNAREIYGNLPKEPEAHIATNATERRGSGGGDIQSDQVSYYFYKVYVQGFDEGTINIYDGVSRSTEEMAFIISGYKTAYYKGRAADRPKANEVWSCEFKTENSTLGSIEIKSKIRNTDRQIVRQDGSARNNGSRGSFRGGRASLIDPDPPVDASTVSDSNPVNDGDGWETTGTSLRTPEQVGFIQELVSRLRTQGWQYELQVTSVNRTPQSQASIMVRNERSDPGWFRRTYSRSKHRWSDMQRALSNGEVATARAIIEEGISLGNYYSSHLRKGAFDIRSKFFTWSEAKTIYDTLEQMKADETASAGSGGGVKSFKWEKVIQRGYERNEERRRNGGPAIPNEHFHIEIKT